MIEVSALLFTLLIESIGLLSIILIVWIILVIRKKNKDKAAATQLVANIKQHADDRLESIKIFLQAHAGLESEELHLAVKKMDRLEKDFFTQLVRCYLKREGDILSEMDEKFDEIITAYKESIVIIATTEDVKQESAHDIETLEKEKQALEQELKITKNTMGNMMTEFNTMFSGGNETIQTSKEALQTSVAEIEDKKHDEPNVVVEQAQAATASATQTDISKDDAEASAPKPIDVADDDDVFFSQEEEVDASTPTVMNEVEEDDDILFSQNKEPSAPQPMRKSDDDFGSIVSTDDVDDILDGIDLSKEIDEE